MCCVEMKGMSLGKIGEEVGPNQKDTLAPKGWNNQYFDSKEKQYKSGIRPNSEEGDDEKIPGTFNYSPNYRPSDDDQTFSTKEIKKLRSQNTLSGHFMHIKKDKLKKRKLIISDVAQYVISLKLKKKTKN